MVRCSMKRITREWIEKAEGDFRTATRELAVLSDPMIRKSLLRRWSCVEKSVRKSETFLE